MIGLVDADSVRTITSPIDDILHTDQPNRARLNGRFTQAIAMSRRNDTAPLLPLLDLDKLKHIDDSLGHAVAASLLQALSQRLVACVGRSTRSTAMAGTNS